MPDLTWNPMIASANAHVSEAQSPTIPENRA